MDSRTMAENLNYICMEKDIRQLALDKRIAKPEAIAVMSDVEVSELILQYYEIKSCETDKILLVEKNKLEYFDNITAWIRSKDRR